MQSILTINSGSSSIKFALYQAGELLKRKLYGKIDRISTLIESSLKILSPLVLSVFPLLPIPTALLRNLRFQL